LEELISILPDPVVVLLTGSGLKYTALGHKLRFFRRWKA